MSVKILIAGVHVQGTEDMANITFTFAELTSIVFGKTSNVTETSAYFSGHKKLADAWKAMHAHNRNKTGELP